ncbi:hypothetical protein T03_3982 [Trichinella britovi]|uniref:Uncharacterized protein n=1 Tax=Trichinella britovi TaxID=45882 RepID=A0A0V1D4I9_TRIBR|nr:hypothetical protein T03_3982 [Trichinella britovi]
MPGLAGACLLLMDEFGTVWAYAVRGDDRNFQLKITLTPNMVDCCERANATTVNTFNGIDECFLTGDANFPKYQIRFTLGRRSWKKLNNTNPFVFTYELHMAIDTDDDDGDDDDHIIIMIIYLEKGNFQMECLYQI